MGGVFSCELVNVRDFELTGQAVKMVFGHGAQFAVAEAIREAVRVAKNEHRFKNQSGDLEKSIGGEVITSQQGGAEGVVYAKSEHASFVEEDTTAHIIMPKAARGTMGPLPEGQTRRKRGTGGPRAMLAWEGSGGQGDWHFARIVHHPGTTGQPFMGPAQQKAERVAIRVIEECVPAAQKVIDG